LCGSKNVLAPGMGADRAEKYGLSIKDYKKRNLLTTEVTSAKVAYMIGDLCLLSDHINLAGLSPMEGPNDETPAEVRMSRLVGASMVGMSTVPEAVAANHMGAEVLGISLVTNLAAGISENPLSGEEVMETAAEAAGRFNSLFDALLPHL